jgi:hypothetical protein
MCLVEQDTPSAENVIQRPGCSALVNPYRHPGVWLSDGILPYVHLMSRLGTPVAPAEARRLGGFPPLGLGPGQLRLPGALLARHQVSFCNPPILSPLCPAITSHRCRHRVPSAPRKGLSRSLCKQLEFQQPPSLFALDNVSAGFYGSISALSS